MTLTVAIALNVVLDIAILALLAFTMSRASKLRPHVRLAARERLVVQPAARRRAGDVRRRYGTPASSRA